MAGLEEDPDETDERLSTKLVVQTYRFFIDWEEGTVVDGDKDTDQSFASLWQGGTRQL